VDIHNTTNQITSIISFSTFHRAFDVAVFVLAILVCVHFGLHRGCFGLICGPFVAVLVAGTDAGTTLLVLAVKTVPASVHAH